MNYIKKLTWILISILILSVSCTTIEEELSDEANILRFRIEQSDNPSLSRDYTGIIDAYTLTITLVFDAEVSVTSLIPTVTVSPGAVVTPSSGTAIDFTNPVQFKVTSSSGNTVTYTVNLSLPNSEPSISVLLINDAICPFDNRSSSFFYPVTETNQAGSKFFCTGQHIAELIIEGQKIENGGIFSSSLLKTGNTLTITPVNASGTSGESIKVLLTSLPLVNISVSGPIVDEPKRECYISIIDPMRKTNKGQHYFAMHRAGIEIRGGLSQSFPKKSYGIEFWLPDRDEEVDEGTRIFGIRDDGDWILDAMYIDRARMRNRLSMDMWTAINKVPHIAEEGKAVNGTRGYFVEVIMNNEYLGLYCLSDRVDRKQLKLDKEEGFCYKGKYWSNSVEFHNGEASYNNASKSWDGWEIKYPKTNYSWEPLRDFIRFTANSSNTLFASDLERKIDIDNLVDYLLFTNAIGADDNTGKNSFFSIYNNQHPKFFITAWDLDGTWGRKWNGQAIDLRDGEFIGVTGVPRQDSRYCRPNAFFQRVILQNPSNIHQKMKTRWNEMRQDELSMQVLSGRVTEYRDLLIESGAYTRERQRWPGTANELNTETSFMLGWIENRLRQVDDYVNAL